VTVTTTHGFSYDLAFERNIGWVTEGEQLALRGKRVAIAGMDFGYYADTPYSKTQYYREAVDLVGEENLESIFMRVFNPELGEWFYSDPAYMWYRECFLELAADADCTTYNCTEGGILFGDPIKVAPLAKFLEEAGHG